MRMVDKICGRLDARFVRTFEEKRIYPWFYRSKWHSLLAGRKEVNLREDCYLTARPNPGAGIGHQMANWIAGYYTATFFGLEFAHSPFPDPAWEAFLGLGHQTTTAEELIQERGFKRVKLPRFKYNDSDQVSKIKTIIESYDRKVCFVCEQDQWFGALHLTKEYLQKKFYTSPARIDEVLLFRQNRISIAVHIRRGDIRQGAGQKNPNLSMRWLDNDYFLKILEQVVSQALKERDYEIFIFTQDPPEQLESFKRFKNINFCSEMSAIDSFRHMVFADILITSRSSFSFKPALLNRGIKVCPKDFWQDYPKGMDWLLADQNGDFSTQTISSIRNACES